MGFTSDGKQEIRDLIRKDGGGLRMSALNIGDGTTNFQESDTALENEIDFEGGLSTSPNGDIFTIFAEFKNNDAAITEAGIVSQGSPSDTSQTSFDPTNDVQMARQIIPVINVSSQDKIELTFEVQVKNSN